MPTLSELIIRLGYDAGALDKMPGDIEGRLSQVSKSMAAVGKELTRNVTLPLLAVGGTMVKIAADFEQSMNNVKALTGATGSEFAALEKQAIDLGAATAFSARDAADAMGFLAQAGFKTQEILSSMPSTLDLAAAGSIDLARAADIVTNILTGVQLPIEELPHGVNVLTKAFTSANTDLTQLGEAFKFVGPLGTEAGLTFEEMTAALALMGNAGIQGTLAGTALRGAIARLLDPTKEAAALIEQLGLDAFVSGGEITDFGGFLHQLEQSGITAGQAMALFGQRAGPGMLALLSQGSQAFDQMEQSLVNVDSQFARSIAETKMQGLKGAVEELTGSWETFSITFSKAALGPLLTSLAKSGTELLNSLSKVNPVVLKWATGLGIAAAAIGPVTFALAKLISPIGRVLFVVSGLLVKWGLLMQQIKEAPNIFLKVGIAIKEGFKVLPTVGGAIRIFEKLFDLFEKEAKPLATKDIFGRGINQGFGALTENMKAGEKAAAGFLLAGGKAFEMVEAKSKVLEEAAKPSEAFTQIFKDLAGAQAVADFFGTGGPLADAAERAKILGDAVKQGLLGSLELKPGELSRLKSLYQQALDDFFKTAVPGGLRAVTAAGALGSALGQPLQGIGGKPGQIPLPTGLRPSGFTPEMVEQLNRFKEQQDAALADARVFTVEFTGLFQDMAGVVGDAFTDVIVHGANFREAIGSIFGGLLKALGDFLVQMGNGIIALGTTALAARFAFSSPFAAIAAGFALVAVGKVLGGLGGKVASIGVDKGTPGRKEGLKPFFGTAPQTTTFGGAGSPEALGDIIASRIVAAMPDELTTRLRGDDLEVVVRRSGQKKAAVLAHRKPQGGGF